MPDRILLIGQTPLLGRLDRQLSLLADPPEVLGWIATDAVVATDAAPSLGTLDDLDAVLADHRPDAAVVCLPAQLSRQILAIRTRLRRLGVPDRYVPPLEDLLAGVGPRTVLDVDPADLLGRPARPLRPEAADAVLTGRRVLITGAGGSIGSELARLVARHRPASLVLVDRSERALFEIDRRIAMIAPELSRRAVLHDVVDCDRTLELFGQVRPEVVLHAAAHKHVPMMEDHPASAIDNNLFGTVSVLDAAVTHHARRFVMISTDKAVRPSSVMGITKRLAELYVRSVDRTTNTTTCSMVRFGNVLGSAGSVLETWTSQLRDGGPITVTDPRMTRYFMTIPEAAALVVEAAALVRPDAPCGEVFVLDMGEPVSIDAFARRFVRAHGLEPVALRGDDAAAAATAATDDATKDATADATDGAANDQAIAPRPVTGTMPIVYTGVRPGEKLHEDLGYDDDAMTTTAHPGVNAWQEPFPDPALITRMLDLLSPPRRVRDPRLLAAELRRLAEAMQASLDARPLAIPCEPKPAPSRASAGTAAPSGTPANSRSKP